MEVEAEMQIGEGRDEKDSAAVGGEVGGQKAGTSCSAAAAAAAAFAENDGVISTDQMMSRLWGVTLSSEVVGWSIWLPTVVYLLAVRFDPQNDVVWCMTGWKMINDGLIFSGLWIGVRCLLRKTLMCVI